MHIASTKTEDWENRTGNAMFMGEVHEFAHRVQTVIKPAGLDDCQRPGHVRTDAFPLSQRGHTEIQKHHNPPRATKIVSAKAERRTHASIVGAAANERKQVAKPQAARENSARRNRQALFHPPSFLHPVPFRGT